MDTKKIAQIIAKRLRQTVQRCHFKKAFVEAFLKKGWACVHVKTFAAELADELKAIDDENAKTT